MKKTLIILVLLFSSSVFAEDISDFEIEGMSIGDSLLDYMTEEEILEEIELSLSLNEYFYLKEPNKYVEVYLYKDFPTYDTVTFFVKNNSEEFDIIDRRILVCIKCYEQYYKYLRSYRKYGYVKDWR